MSESEALKSLGAFPLVQAALFVMVVLAGIWVFLQSKRDSRANGNQSQIPQWVMMGPVNDAIRSIHAIAERGRDISHILERHEDHLKDIAKEQRETNQLLEIIRNESRLR